MNPDRKVTRDGIHIDAEVAEAVAIEAELDSNVVGPYRFPDPRRRLVPAVIYLVAAGAAWMVSGPIGGLLLAGAAVVSWAGAWPLRIEDSEALTRAAAAVDFRVGHASAAVTFHGLRARPRWSVVLYSAAEPPDRRALVTIDGVTGERTAGVYEEEL